eukprot:CAMPEP_0176487634 /NCGR_PEP_ID=MMETSP0200_2-20121128/6252_1 /TAXON_ID=947934 /ORGANISM="Chaetoceros sp., Strain GSL56" /LENGTH=378 /DNA_ID=CAMNT_0017884507 /DNA_START=436 /DNA_END=1568 /DNA_ORIENTATION=+
MQQRTNIITQLVVQQRRRPYMTILNLVSALVSTVILIGFCCRSSSTSAGVYIAGDGSRFRQDSAISANKSSSSPPAEQQGRQDNQNNKGDYAAEKVLYTVRSVEEFSSSSSSSTCLNNPNWNYNYTISDVTTITNNNSIGAAQVLMDCWSIHQSSSESQRVELCQVEEVHHNCPITCGVCCQDDPNYILLRNNGMYASCDWLSENQSRKDRYCDTYNSDAWVWSACPLTCSRCKSYVSLPPSHQPSDLPSGTPTQSPSLRPSPFPTQSQAPSHKPTTVPSILPTEIPTDMPTVHPTTRPSEMPSWEPTSSPSWEPSLFPTLYPSTRPSLAPTFWPTNSPSDMPSTAPSVHPSEAPSVLPSNEPTLSPSIMPTHLPTMS